jgi:hypothetical protein
LRQLQRVRGFDVELDRAVAALPGLAGELEEAGVRHFVECAALALQAAALLEAAPDIITSAFVATRFHSPGLTFGASRSDIPCEALLERASPTAS